MEGLCNCNGVSNVNDLATFKRQSSIVGVSLAISKRAMFQILYPSFDWLI